MSRMFLKIFWLCCITIATSFCIIDCILVIENSVNWATSVTHAIEEDSEVVINYDILKNHFCSPFNVVNKKYNSITIKLVSQVLNWGLEHPPQHIQNNINNLY